MSWTGPVRAMLAVTVTLVVGAALATPVSAAPATPSVIAPVSLDGPPDTVPSVVPSPNTPRVDNGAVLTIAEVGSTMVIGGTFTSVNGASRPYVVAFDGTSGAVETGFAPGLDGPVNAVLPGPTAGTVYLGGSFRSVNGQPTPYLTLVQLSDGQAVPGFHAAAIDGYVSTVVLRNGVLFIGGVFTHVGGLARGGLAALDAATGVLSGFATPQFTGDHNISTTGVHGQTGVRTVAINAAGTTMVLLGNFTYVNGVPRDQIAMLDISGAGAALDPWATNDFAPLCSNNSVDSYVRGVAFSPDGSYFVVTTQGGGHPRTHCDAVSRYETDPNNAEAHSTWIDQTGGDSLWGAAVTDTAIFIGGHNRWLNNPLSINSARAGAVPRPGLAAVDPVSGRPLAWNPGRVPLGAEVYAFLVTSDGLWMGSDTDYVGDHQYFRPKIVLFPWSGGSQVAATAVPHLPGHVFLGGTSGTTSTLTDVAFDGSHASASPVSTQGIRFARWHGAFLVGSTVFYGFSDGYLYSRSFDGTTFGPAVRIDPYHDPAWKNVQTGLGDTFDGRLPSFYAKIPTVSGLTYWQGRVYFTLVGDSHLYAAWFSPDSGIIDQTIATQTSSVDLSQADGLFVSGSTLYYGSTDGALRAVGWSGGTVVGSPQVVSGPGVDGVNWANTALFLSGG